MKIHRSLSSVYNLYREACGGRPVSVRLVGEFPFIDGQYTLLHSCLVQACQVDVRIHESYAVCDAHLVETIS